MERFNSSRLISELQALEAEHGPLPVNVRTDADVTLAVNIVEHIEVEEIGWCAQITAVPPES